MTAKLSPKALIPMAIMLLAIYLIGCEGSSLDPLEGVDFRVSGVLIEDQNPDSSVVLVSFERNSTAYAGGSVKIDSEALLFNVPVLPVDSVFSLRKSPASAFTAGPHTVRLEDSQGRLVDNVTVSAVGLFGLTDSFDPANHLLQGAEQLSFGWTIATNAEAYVVGAVKADRAYSGAGYSSYAPFSATAGTIPPEAFLIPGTDDPDTGLFNIYAYAINGAPDSALVSSYLPVPLPGQIADNIDSRNVSGRFGSISVTVLDTVRVAIQ